MFNLGPQAPCFATQIEKHLANVKAIPDGVMTATQKKKMFKVSAAKQRWVSRCRGGFVTTACFDHIVQVGPDKGRCER